MIFNSVSYGEKKKSVLCKMLKFKCLKDFGFKKNHRTPL